MAESKLLDYNIDKSGMILFGTKKFKKQIEEEMEKNPVIFCKAPMKIFKCERYLGEYMGNSLPESVFQTIKRRKGLVSRLISEIKVTLEDARSDSVGGILVGLEIWTKAVCPYLFNNSSCWVEIPKKALDLLTSITHSFYRSLFLAPKGTPIFSFYWDTGLLLENNFLMKEKLLLVHHLSLLPDSALAKEAYLLQKEDKTLPGLVRECEEFLNILQINEDPSVYTKPMWKKKIHSAIHSKNKRELLAMLESYKKLDKEKLKQEDYGQKSYLKSMKMDSARTFFSARASMLGTIKLTSRETPSLPQTTTSASVRSMSTTKPTFLPAASMRGTGRALTS